MALNCKHDHPLQHDGTSQQQRFLEALEPGYAPIHEFNLKDWMTFAWYFATHLKYYNLSDDNNADGDWQLFMKAEDEIKDFLKDAALVQYEDWIPEEDRDRIINREKQSNYEPHLALFLSFLKLMRFPKEHLNGITKRHLDFYYYKVLRISKKPAIPDRVHVIFELAKNASEEIVYSNTLLDAGKDKNSKSLRYSTAEEIVVNTSKVALMKSIHHKEGQIVRYAEMTNSVDGMGTEFKDEFPSWNAFSNDSWPAATLGFAFGSSVLLLKEGQRDITISLTLKLTETGNIPPKEKIESQLKIFLTGEKDWINAKDFKVIQAPVFTTDKLVLTINVSPSEKAIVPYNKNIHKEHFNTNLPVIRFMINTLEADGYNVYRALSKAIITEAEIMVDVSGARDIAVENDNGKLDPSKPFLPFGPVPKKDSGFYVGSQEIFQKNWDYIKLNINWKNKPEKLDDYYKAYRLEFINNTSSDYNLTTSSLTGTAIVTDNDYFTVFPQYIKDNKWYPVTESADLPGLFDKPLIVYRDASDPRGTSMPVIPSLLMRKGIDVNKATLQNYLFPQVNIDPGEPAYKQIHLSSRFSASKFDPGFADLFTTIENFSSATHSCYLKLTLQKDFMHDHYAHLLTLAILKKTTATSGTANVLIPNQPYTPQIASITLDYHATSRNIFFFPDSARPREKYDNFTTRAIQLFHENPFGQAEQHVFLKEQCDFIDPSERRNIYLIPRYNPEGEFYIGLQHAQPFSIVNLLVQVVEGSEDPLAPTFTNDQKIEWFCLSNNEWKSLNRDFITSNSTNNFLRPGIVRITLPKMANDSNTILDEDYIWLKAQLPAGLSSVSVCRLTDIYAQAVEAVFTDNGNELSHLSASLPSFTISKFVEKPALIKGLAQPYPSFGGKPEENDHSFYLRVSERLRHKKRAVNIWDYERLILQEFPSAYKVKCISHTCTHGEDKSPDYFELSPGSVTLVVIPDIRNHNSYDPLQPRASQNLLREIEDFIRPLNSLHIRFDADNPEYETVFLSFHVKFYDQFDANAYRKILNEDLIRYLSPWAFGEFSDIHFGGSLNKSVIIRFIEELDYVDFISRFKMYLRIGDDDGNIKDHNIITASNARSILVSARNHDIGLIEKDKVCNE